MPSADELRLTRFCQSYGVANAVAVVAAHSAGSNRPELSQCLAMLEQESGGTFEGVQFAGGLNIFQHGGPFPQISGQPVTPELAEFYVRERERTGLLTGVGPPQLTSKTLQIDAQQHGGLWDPRATCSVGFVFLHAMMVEHGTAGGFEAYNGWDGPPGEDPYVQRAVFAAAVWHDRLQAHGMPAR